MISHNKSISLIGKYLRNDYRSREVARRSKPRVESLETRVVLYSASGNAWPNPQLVTISFMPDGTSLGSGITSNLQATFNAKTSLNGKWQNIILQAAQQWAQQTNINLAVVPDNGAAEGSGSNQQGDPNFGDIRIGGYNFGSSTLALTYQPPPANNFSLAGDMTFNTGQAFNVGTTYDLFTVALHEFGHAFGLNESSVSNSIEYGTYNGVKTGLAADDITGIRAIYGGARRPDMYGGANTSLTTAASITSLINPTTMTALVPNLDIATAGQSQYFTFTAPTGTGSTLSLDVQSTGLSLLSPKVTVYGSNGTTVLASATATGLYGTTLNVSVPSVTAGTKYYVMVQGAVTNQMGTGNYALGLNFKGATPPVEASLVKPIANGAVKQSGSGQADGMDGKSPYVGAVPTITGITPDTGVSTQDGITTNPNIAILGDAVAGDLIGIFCNGVLIGVTTAQNTNTFNFSLLKPLSDGIYEFLVTATDTNGWATSFSFPFQVQIDTHLTAAPILGNIAPDTGASSTDGITNSKNPTFSGFSEAFAVINLYSNGSSTPFGTTTANIAGMWTYTIPGSGWSDGTYQVTATATDVAGTTSAASQVETVRILSVAPSQPSVTAVSPDTGKNNDGVTTATNLIFSGTGSAGTSVSVFLNGLLLGKTTVASNGTWSYDNTLMTLPVGTYSITSQSTDLAGNVSGLSSAFKLTVESVGTPVVSAASLTTQGNGQQSMNITGTAPANDTVQVYLNGTLQGTVVANALGAWTFTYTPSTTTITSGTYAITAVAMDQYQNLSAASLAYQYQVGTPGTASGINSTSPTATSGTAPSTTAAAKKK